MKIRLATKVGSTQFAQVTYRGADGEVQYDEFWGVNVVPTGLEVYQVTPSSVRGRSIAQHQRGVSRSLSLDEDEMTEFIPWDEAGVTFADLKDRRTVGLKKAVGAVLVDLYEDIEIV